MRFIRNSLFLVVLFLIQCKSSNVGNESQEEAELTSVIMLLQEGISPSDISYLSEVQIESTKRVSRTQNLWMIQVSGEDATMQELLNDLKKDDRVVELSLDEENKNSDISNTKAGKSDPIKNK